MDKPVSAADANRKFSQLLKAVKEGRSYVVTSHGKPVARIVPAAKSDGLAAAGRKALLTRLRSQPVVKVGRWLRGDLYERSR